MNNPKGFILLEVLLALVILVCGTVVVVQSFRSSMKVIECSQEQYEASLLMENQMATLETTGQIDTTIGTDSFLAPISWNQDFQDGVERYWRRDRITMSWRKGTHDESLELSTYLWK